jgi:hypothetical protein
MEKGIPAENNIYESRPGEAGHIGQKKTNK